MSSDVIDFVNAVGRELTLREKDGAMARVLVATRVYETSAEDLWDALTNPERIPRWFLPISGDLRLGGSYQLEGNAGGEILQCEPPHQFGLTWGMQGQVSWVTVSLSEELDGRTLLRLEHTAHVPDEMWKQYGPGAVGVGWDSALLGLDRHVTTGADRPEDVVGWLTSGEGRSFVGASSDAWCAAAIAAGTSPDEAHAAAARTTAAYTGEEEAPMDR